MDGYTRNERSQEGLRGTDADRKAPLPKGLPLWRGDLTAGRKDFPRPELLSISKGLSERVFALLERARHHQVSDLFVGEAKYLLAHVLRVLAQQRRR